MRKSLPFDLDEVSHVIHLAGAPRKHRLEPPVPPFDGWERSIVPRYTEGDCWVLALELARYPGWELAVSGSEGHAFAYDPRSGLALDVYGPRPLRHVLGEWFADHARIFHDHEAARIYFESWGHWSERILWRQAELLAAALVSLEPA